MAGEFKNADLWTVKILQLVDMKADEHSDGEPDHYPSGIKDELMFARYGHVAITEPEEGVA